MAGLYAITGALLVLAGAVSQDGVNRPVRAALMLTGALLLVGALIVSIAAATLE